MKERTAGLERWYSVLTATEDLLAGARAAREHEPFQARVDALVTTTDRDSASTDGPTSQDRASQDRATAASQDGASRDGATATSRDRTTTTGTASRAAFHHSGIVTESTPGVVPGNTPSRFSHLATWSIDQRRERLDELAAEIQVCDRCPLSLSRNHAVPGTGVLDPLVMIVGEGPGANEDREGLPFVGKAGQYLDKWLESIGLSRTQNVFIANIVKCRPPGNRDPMPEESDACSPFLAEQIALVRPRLILTVGRISTRLLTGTTHGITRIHGTFYHWNGIPLVPTFHPSGVLRNPAWRRPVWEDLKKVRNWLIDHADHVAPEISS